MSPWTARMAISLHNEYRWTSMSCTGLSREEQHPTKWEALSDLSTSSYELPTHLQTTVPKTEPFLSFLETL